MIDAENEWYYQNLPRMMLGLLASIVLLLVLSLIVFYEVMHRPLPTFTAKSNKGAMLSLVAHDSPNLMSTTLLQWASKATVAAYTFDFVNYDKQIANSRRYFTATGWRDYQLSVKPLIESIVQKQLFVNGVVYAPPVIANQINLGDGRQTWEIQLPFLVTYQSAEKITRNTFLVRLTVTRVPTSTQPTGIGIEKFVMAKPR